MAGVATNKGMPLVPLMRIAGGVTAGTAIQGDRCLLEDGDDEREPRQPLLAAIERNQAVADAHDTRLSGDRAPQSTGMF